MKTAIYIEDGVVQLVLTPQNDFEKNALSSFEDKALSTKIIVGEFYDCRGGWTKQAVCDFGPLASQNNPRSLIIRNAVIQDETASA